MTDVWEAPGKINLSLRVQSIGSDGFHPLRSLTQTVEWLDTLEVSLGDDHRLMVEGADLDDGSDNLVWKAVHALVGRPDQPRLSMTLRKVLPVAAGLGGGSADAAAALMAAGAVYGVQTARIAEVATSVGADVPFFLRGGTMLMEGRGERLSEMEPLAGFAVAIAVPPMELATPAVFRRWDELGEPDGSGVVERDLPPRLRGGEDMVNDLLPAALDLAPELGDFMAEVCAAWGRSVAMSGSGPSVFGYFSDAEEATAAIDALTVEYRSAMGAALRSVGVRRGDR
jgi:4-diphosphocytidyl-2-C-methyl-D-erythritol kinase